MSPQLREPYLRWCSRWVIQAATSEPPAARPSAHCLITVGSERDRASAVHSRNAIRSSTSRLVEAYGASGSSSAAVGRDVALDVLPDRALDIAKPPPRRWW